MKEGEKRNETAAMKCHKRLPVIQFSNSHTGKNNHKHAGAVTWVRCHHQRLFLIYSSNKKKKKKTDRLSCRWFYDIDDSFTSLTEGLKK